MQLEELLLKITLMKVCKDYRISIFDSDNFSYEILGIEIDDETKRIILKVRDSILVPITRLKKDGTHG